MKEIKDEKFFMAYYDRKKKKDIRRKRSNSI